MTSNTFVYTTYIRSTPEKVWAALTSPEFTRQYWGGMTNVSDWKKGSTWEHQDTNSKDAPFLTGEVLESVPPKRLVVTWIDARFKGDTSRAAYDIEMVHDMVRLTVTHDEFKADSVLIGKVATGWPLVLSSLKSFLETGKAIDLGAIKSCNTPHAA